MSGMLRRPVPIAAALVVLLLGVLVPVSGSGRGVNAASIEACDGSAITSGLKITPLHGKVFYVDTGLDQSADAAYVGYRVEAEQSAENLWLQVADFSGGVVQLADPSDHFRRIGNLSPGGTQSAFFFVKASIATSAAQKHNVKLFEGRPDLSTAQLLGTCIFEFVEVRETIKAAANKVTKIETSTGTPEIGGEYIVTVEGQTGTVGAGSDPDGALIWVTPAARSDWPTSVLRLTGTQIDLYGNKNCTGTPTSYLDTLIIDFDSGQSQKCYRATYTFLIAGTTSNQILAVPLAQISSGTQIKHTDLSGAVFDPTSGDSLVVDLETETLNLTVTISASTATTVNADTTAVAYTVQLVNASSSAVVVDDIVVTTEPELTYATGSASFQGSSTEEPGQIGSGAELYFTGPFSVSASSTATLTFTLQIPCGSNNAGTNYQYTSAAFAEVGSTQIGADPVTISGVQVDGTCGTTDATTEDAPKAFSISASTRPATAVQATSADLNAIVNPEGRTDVPVSFDVSQAADLTDSVRHSVSTVGGNSGSTASGSAPLSAALGLASLSPATTYYFRVVAGSSGGDYAEGEILTFTTPSQAADPTVSTGIASAISPASGTATLNATIDPNLTTTKVLFEWAESGTAGDCSGLSSQMSQYSWTDADDDNAYDAGEENIFQGSSSSVLELDISGLAADSDFCFRAVATFGSDGRAEGTWTPFTTKVSNPPATTSPPTAPGAPTGALANAGDSAATVSWSAPSDDGGEEITQYTVTGSGGQQCTTSGATTCVVRGLTNGVTYTFTVTATNTVGTSSPSAPSAPVTLPQASAPCGYWLVDQSGAVYNFTGRNQFETPALSGGRLAVDIEATSSGGGLWVLDSGGVFHTYGDANSLAPVNTSGLSGLVDYLVASDTAEELLAFSPTASGNGVLVFTSAGGVIAVGDAQTAGDLQDVQLNSPVVSAVADPDGDGYWLVAADGGVFAFNAEFYGSIPQIVPEGLVAEEWLNEPIVGMTPTPEGEGYWLVAADGGVFSFGDARYWGSIPGIVGGLAPGLTAQQWLNGPIVGMVPYGSGYLMVASEGGVFTFSDCPFKGSLGANPPADRVLAITPIPKGSPSHRND